MVHITYSGNPIDRRANLRPNEDELRIIFTSGAARIVPVWSMKHLFDANPRAQVLSFTQISATVDVTRLEPVFLGFSDDVPWFALGLPDSDTPPTFGTGAEYKTLNEVVTLLPGTEASILAYARAMVIWHGNHRYCGKCGATAKPTEGGHSRTCTNDTCAHRMFPRTDPAVITLIENEARTHCLLGRQARWVPGMYSVIAGFVEPGESLEETVIRETLEETGVPVTDVRYLASQPWPFPSSIMLGFRAKALSMDIHRTDDELEDVRWYTRDDLRSFGKPGPYEAFRLPNPFSIARFLLNTWLDEEKGV
ncbi:MAG: NAD(+) diphosphatase [Rhodospirillaceae bacterium]|nr:NAD(+) diphosphatase [Rhodospirillaceae bacterium]